MPTDSGYLCEIHCYFLDGSVAKFGQTDPAALQELLSTIQHPSKIFGGRNILIRAEDCVTAVRPSFVTRLDLISDQLPDWHYLHGATDVRQVWRGDIEARFTPDAAKAEREAASHSAGQTQKGFVSLHLSDQQTIYWEVTMESQVLVGADIERYLSAIVDAGGLHAKREGGGVMIVNSANIAQVRFYPGPPQLPARAWRTQTRLF
jgi:hypothetical protein